jgi:hypothetical protein
MSKNVLAQEFICNDCKTPCRVRIEFENIARKEQFTMGPFCLCDDEPPRDEATWEECETTPESEIIKELQKEIEELKEKRAWSQ